MSQGHPTFEGMPAKLFSASPAKLDTWLGCPRRYRWQYLDRPPVPQLRWARTMMGNVAHSALRAWWADDAANLGEVETRITTGWDPMLFRDESQSQRALIEVQTWVRNYLEKHDSQDEVLGVERTVSTKTEHLTISGRIDRIDRRDGEVVVVDYKTGRGELTDDDARTSMTLAIYADSIHRSMRQECYRVELHHLPTSTVASHRHSPESLARHLGRADAIGVEISQAQHLVTEGGDPEHHFPAQPGPLCGWCDYWSICEVGRAATTQREPWAGVDEKFE